MKTMEWRLWWNDNEILTIMQTRLYLFNLNFNANEGMKKQQRKMMQLTTFKLCYWIRVEKD